MTRSILRWLPWLALGFAVAICLGTMGILAHYAQANGDDYCRARLLPMTSAIADWGPASCALEYAGDSWSYWTGRWLAMLVQTVVLSAVDITRSYTLVLLGAWSFLLGGLYLTSRALLASETPHRVVVGASTLILLVLFWSGMPAPGNGLYWFTGIVENVLSIAAGAVVVAALSHGLRATGPSRVAAVTVAGIGALVVPGLHEIYGVALWLTLVAGTFILLRARARGVSLLILCTVLASIGVAAVMIAPGNRVRGTFQPEPDLMFAVKLTIAELLRYAPGWVLSVPLLAATMVFILHPGLRALEPSWVQRHFAGWHRYLIPVVTSSIIVLGLLGPSYALSRAVPVRTVNGLYLVFLLGWFFTVFVFTRRRAVPEANSRRVDGLTASAVLALAGSLVFTGNTRVGLSDLRHTVTPWHASMQARYEILRSESGGAMTIHLPPAARAPELFIGRDILEDATNWRNRCFAEYFQVAAVSLRAAAAPSGAAGSTPRP